MKKLSFILVFFVFCGISVFGINDTHEEVDFLLFMPNSGNRFVNKGQASVQLDNIARYLLDKNLVPGQIIVCGYAAYSPNRIKSVDLSKERALFVMNELQKRGVSKDLFDEPVGYGAVYLWGNNADENAKKLNRRVRILLHGEFSGIETPSEEVRAIDVLNTVVDEPLAPEIVLEAARGPELNAALNTSPKAAPKKVDFRFPWWILLIMAIYLILFFLIKKKPGRPVYKDEINDKQAPFSKTSIIPAFIPSDAVTTCTVNLDDEIRSRAYELSQQRRAGRNDADLGNGQEDYQEQDWYDAVREISAMYTARGHSVYNDDGYWWASRSYSW